MTTCVHATFVTSNATNMVKMYATGMRASWKTSTPVIQVSPMTLVRDAAVFIHFL